MFASEVVDTLDQEVVQLRSLCEQIEHLDDDGVLDTTLAVERLRRAVDAVASVAIGEVDRRELADATHGFATTGWLARDGDLAPCTARPRVHVARQLQRWLPSVRAALVAGRIGWDEAHLLAKVCTPRIAPGFDVVARVLIEARPGRTWACWRAEVLRAADELDQDGAHRPAADDGPGTLQLCGVGADTVVLRGTLRGATAATVDHGIETVADELFRTLRADQEATGLPSAPPGRAELRALALAELVRRGLALGPPGDGHRCPTTVAEVTLVIDADDLATVRRPEHAATSQIPEHDQALLWCNAQFTAVVVDSLGMPLDVGPTVRHPTAAQRRALARRDGGCIFPGCDAPPAWTDAHHLVPWAEGGSTDLANLASLCRHHHRVLHRPGWQLHHLGQGRFTITTPRGTTRWAQRHRHVQPGTAPPPPP